MKKTGKLCLLLFLFAIHIPYIQAQFIDIDIDPLAYAFNGFSVHAGFNTEHFRYDIGVYGIEVPEFFHGNEGFNNYIWGAGAKADYYFTNTEKGFYTGFGIDLTTSRIRLTETGNETTIMQFAAGLNAGYKIKVSNHLFVKPWFGLSYLFNANEIEMDDQRFKQSSIRPFPTVHIGWAF